MAVLAGTLVDNLLPKRFAATPVSAVLAESHSSSFTPAATARTIAAHASRTGWSTEQLTQALLQHASQQLAEWAVEQENTDPGGWLAADAAPDWLLPHLPHRGGLF